MLPLPRGSSATAATEAGRVTAPTRLDRVGPTVRPSVLDDARGRAREQGRRMLLVVVEGQASAELLAEVDELVRVGLLREIERRKAA